MRTLELKLFKYNELGEKAKEKAREWLCEQLNGPWFEAEHITDTLKEDCLNYHGFEPKDVAWDYNHHVASFGATLDFDGLAEDGDSHPELRAEVIRLAKRLERLEYSVCGVIECDWYGQGPKSVEACTEAARGEPSPELRDWVKEHIPTEDPLFQPVIEALTPWNRPDYAPLLAAFDKWEEGGIDVSEPRSFYAKYGPEAQQEAENLRVDLERALEEWAEAVCRDLRDMAVGEVDYLSNETRLAEDLENSDWEFTKEGKFYRTA
jgi:hypothetical protein